MRSAVVAIALVLAAPGLAHAQDAAAGEKVYTQCRACHQIGPTAKNAVGPAHNGLFGRKERCDILTAAVVNGVSSHVMDFDDTDPRTGKAVGLPLAGGRTDGSYPVGPVRVSP